MINKIQVTEHAHINLNEFPSFYLFKIDTFFSNIIFLGFFFSLVEQTHTFDSRNRHLCFATATLFSSLFFLSSCVCMYHKYASVYDGIYECSGYCFRCSENACIVSCVRTLALSCVYVFLLFDIRENVLLWNNNYTMATAMIHAHVLYLLFSLVCLRIYLLGYVLYGYINVYVF